MACKPSALSQEQVERAKQMHAWNVPYAAIATALGVATDTVKRAVVPGFGQFRAAQVKTARMEKRSYVAIRNEMNRELGAAKRALGMTGQVARRVPEADIAARLAEIPEDHRSLTARTFGDPLPGRSALDRRRGA